MKKIKNIDQIWSKDYKNIVDEREIYENNKISKRTLNAILIAIPLLNVIIGTILLCINFDTFDSILILVSSNIITITGICEISLLYIIKNKVLSSASSSIVIFMSDLFITIVLLESWAFISWIIFGNKILMAAELIAFILFIITTLIHDIFLASHYNKIHNLK